ncbi:MAG: CrcB family protein [Microbacteriaceae bacterium]
MTLTFTLALSVAVAGGLGATLRYLATLVLPLPWGVLAVNTVGSAVAGVALALADAAAISGDIRLVLVTGFAGGLTTFSTFSVETIELARDGRWRTATLNVVASLAAGIGLALGGYALTAALI